jgi:mono/diheme cytochrome c family protein
MAHPVYNPIRPLLIALAWLYLTAPGRAADKDDLLAVRVLPLLKEKCLACHGDDAQKLNGKLDLRSRAGVLKGGASGKPAVVPGKPEQSPLFLAVTRQNPDLVMPPKDNDRLSAEQVELIRQWITAGAPWPVGHVSNVPSSDGVTVATSGGRSPEWTNRKYQPEDLWAYQPVRKPPVPAIRNPQSTIRNPLDAFIQQKLAAKGLTQAPPADKRTLIRRVTFDLTGLPPALEDVEAFVKDDSLDAFDRLVQRLLVSPQYGEQQARHWLDVVRYADTSGYSNDFERPQAWRYRDYVIRSFNADKPFDRFVVEQLAGDELDPQDPELLIAVGFLRMGPWEHTGMTVAAVTRQDFLDDVTHNVGVALLGQGLRCARCHDHKFDPVPTKDYYRMQAVFAPTQFAERPLPFLPVENTSGMAAGKAQTERHLRESREVLESIRKKGDAALAAFLKDKGVAQVTDLPAKERPHRESFGLTKQELSIRKIYQKRVQYFERELLRFEPYAFSVYSGPANNYTSVRPINPMPAKRDGAVPVVHILTGGSLETPAEAVQAGVLSAVKERAIPEATEGRRLALAQWITSRDNPLTARVLVNRVWQQHFGRGLAATPNNFGKMGGRPTHPELLDWLAAWFMDNGWSLKKLHALILSSATYQQSGLHPDAEKLRQADAKNELLAYYPPRRLAAEELRDAMLAVTGELNREPGGPGVFPEINREVAHQPRHIMGSVAPAYQPSPLPQQRNRRTVYAFRYRTLADPLLEVFNRPGSETSCELRDQTTVTPQVFALFNGEFAHDRALALAAALERQGKTLAEQVGAAFRMVYGRDATERELALGVTHVRQMTEHHRQHLPEPVPLPQSVKRRMVEEMTGEDVEWEEKLDVTSYVRDLKPWDVGPQTRALADLCLVLLNSNEFLYVR